MAVDASPTFSRPRASWFLVLDGGIAALAMLALNDSAYRKVREVAPLPEKSELRRLLGGTVGVHIVEATLARRSARRKGLPAKAVRKWTRQTFLVGFPSLLQLRKIPSSHATLVG